MARVRTPRILHVSSTYPPLVVGGAEKVVEQLAEAQAAAGLEVGVAYLVRDARPAGERNGVQIYPQASRNLIWMEDVMRKPRPMRTASKLYQVINLGTANDIACVIEDFGADIVHTHSMVELPPHIWSRAKAAGAGVVHTLHDYDLICSRATLFRNGENCAARHASCRILGAWKGRFARHIDAVAAVSAPVLEEHRRHGLFGHVSDSRQRVIWNAVPTHAGPRRTPGGRASEPFTFGFLGRIVPEKGIETLLQACRLLPSEGWTLRVAGRSPGGVAPLEALARNLPVEFAGFVDPVPFLDSLDVLVVPSIWREPFGLTVVEAFARGVPVIGADHGAIADLVRPLGEEWLTPPGNAEALGTRMAEVIADGRDRLPAPNRFRRVLKATRPERMVGDYSRLYADLLPTGMTA